MADKPGYSLLRAIQHMLLSGSPMASAELLGDSSVRAQVESSPLLTELRSRSGRLGSLSFFLPNPPDIRAIDTATGGAGVVGKGFQHSSDLLRRSACVQEGAVVVSGLSGDTNISTTVTLPIAEWVPESGTSPTPGDPVYGVVHILSPKLIAASVTCSKQLLVQSPQAEAIVIEDLSKAVSNACDAAILYGDPVVNPLQPAGILGTAGTHRVVLDPADLWTGVVELSYVSA